MFHRLALSTYPAETRRAGFETLSTSAKGTPPARTRHLWTVEASPSQFATNRMP